MALFHLPLGLSLLCLVGANEVYLGGVVSDGVLLDLGDDPHCTHHIHKFYRQMKCVPETSPDYKCPVSYKCPTLEGRKLDLCYYGGHHYPVGTNLTRDMVDFMTPCLESCQCVRTYEGARFFCSQGAKVKNCTLQTGCKHFNFLEDFPCCETAITSCNQGKKDSVKCIHEGHSYSEGEKFFPSDDITCTQCVCASGFNGTLEAPYCRQVQCNLELWGDTAVMLTRGCIPVYLTDNGCCPLSYRCPKPTDRVVKAENNTGSPLKTGKKCHFGNLTMSVGDKLSPWVETNSKEIECSCRVPPLASCVRRNFRLTEELRKEIAREGLDNHP